MANTIIKDGAGDTKYIKSSGAGSDGDPFILERTDTALSTKVGEVQATPTANTLLGRLKDLLTGIVLAAGSNAIGKLAANSGVDIGDVDVVTVMGKSAGQGTMANSIPVAIASDQSTLTTKGAALSVTATLTVTNGAYTIADVIGGLVTFANAVSANGKSCILNSLTLAGVTAIPVEVWFFSADIATPRADNAVFGLAAADGAICLGIVPIATVDWCSAQTSFANASVRGLGLQMQAGAGTRSIYAYIKALAATSPGTTTMYMTANFEYLD